MITFGATCEDQGGEQFDIRADNSKDTGSHHLPKEIHLVGGVGAAFKVFKGTSMYKSVKHGIFM